MTPSYILCFQLLTNSAPGGWATDPLSMVRRKKSREPCAAVATPLEPSAGSTRRVVQNTVVACLAGYGTTINPRQAKVPRRTVLAMYSVLSIPAFLDTAVFLAILFIYTSSTRRSHWSCGAAAFRNRHVKVPQLNHLSLTVIPAVVDRRLKESTRARGKMRVDAVADLRTVSSCEPGRARHGRSVSRRRYLPDRYPLRGKRSSLGPSRRTDPRPLPVRRVPSRQACSPGIPLLWSGASSSCELRASDGTKRLSRLLPIVRRLHVVRQFRTR